VAELERLVVGVETVYCAWNSRLDAGQAGVTGCYSRHSRHDTGRYLLPVPVQLGWLVEPVELWHVELGQRQFLGERIE
jgi:hypothetical protein